MKTILRNKWFILFSLAFLFFVATWTKAVSAGTENNLAKILETGVDGLIAFFDWLLEVLKVIW